VKALTTLLDRLSYNSNYLCSILHTMELRHSILYAESSLERKPDILATTESIIVDFEPRYLEACDINKCLYSYC
jgi:hypothetical protein